MTKRSSSTRQPGKGVQPTLAGSRLLVAFLADCPLVTGILLNEHSDLVNIKVTYRGPGDYLAILKRYGDDGRPMVLFGSGVDFTSSLLGLETAVDQNKWRPDKYANK